MFVAQSAPKGSFAELVKVVTNAGLQRCLPALAECGARSLADVASCADALIAPRRAAWRRCTCNPRRLTWRRIPNVWRAAAWRRRTP